MSPAATARPDRILVVDDDARPVFSAGLRISVVAM